MNNFTSGLASLRQGTCPTFVSENIKFPRSFPEWLHGKPGYIPIISQVFQPFWGWLANTHQLTGPPWTEVVARFSTRFRSAPSGKSGLHEMGKSLGWTGVYACINMQTLPYPTYPNQTVIRTVPHPTNLPTDRPNHLPPYLPLYITSHHTTWHAMPRHDMTLWMQVVRYSWNSLEDV